MDAIPLPSYEMVPLDHIAPGVAGVRILFVNVFAISSPTGWTLIDAGLALSGSKIKSFAEDHFGKGTRPQAIVLTHGHFDHVGAIEDLLGDWNVPVYAHSAEMPFLTGGAKYPPPDPSVGGGIMAVLSPLYPRTSTVNLAGHVQALPADGSVPTLPGWRYLHTPGHAPGHISLFREEDKVLLPGDAFTSTKQESFLAIAQQKPELHGPPSYYTPDWDSARASVRQLANLRPLTVAPSHGQPMSGDLVAGQLEQLAVDFDRIAVPEHSKYVNTASPQ